ncbi:MAG: endolytic transglycosylase MltG [Patescibacteria group bacterium]
MRIGNFLRFTLAGTIGLLVICALVAGFIGWQGYRFFLASGSAEAVTFVVEKGEGFSAIATRLESEDIIANAFWFRVYAWIDGSARSLQSGTFSVTPGSAYVTLVDILCNGSAEEVSITIPEGLTVAQIGELVMQKFPITQAQWNTATGQYSPLASLPFVVNAGKPAGVDLEGYLFPNTYRFFPDATAEDIAQRMIEELERQIETERVEVPTGKTLHEIITLASVLDREAKFPADYTMIADIFWRRIELGMPLQSDATVSYATGIQDISNADRAYDSPWNTYKYAGLPKGPICNPGIAAIKATVNPKPNDYLYFLTTPEGVAKYAKTYEEHLANKARYLD